MNGTLPQKNGASEDEIDLRDVWNVLMRNRWLIAAFVAVSACAAGAYAFLTTPVYESATSIRIDVLRPGVQTFDIMGAFNRGNEVATEMEVLRSRTIAEDVVSELGLQLTVREPRRAAARAIFPVIEVDRAAPEAEYRATRSRDGRFTVRNVTLDVELGEFAPGERIRLDGATVVLGPAAAEHESLRFHVHGFADAVRAVREALAVGRPNREANLVIVRFQSADTERVHAVPNAVANTFIARRQEVQKTEARSTVEFLTGQIASIAAQLGDAEDALRTFREGEQVVSLTAEATAQVNRLAQLQAQRDGLDAEREALAQLLSEIQREAATAAADTASPYRRLIAFPPLLRNQAASELLRSLATVENQRAQLLNRRSAEHPDVRTLTVRVRELESQLRSIGTTYLEGLSNQVASLDATLGRFGSELERIPAKEIQFARLQRQTHVLEEIYTLLQTRLKEAEIAEAVEDATVRIVDPAISPIRPIKPRKKVLVALGLVLGMMLGVSTAFLREYMDTTVHTREDVQEAAAVPVLGLIPRIRAETMVNGNGASRRNGRAAPGSSADELQSRLVTGHDPRNPVSEAYRSLRTNITFSSMERQPKTLVFTSPTPGDGKSTSAANLAITLAQQGLKTLLIDGDMRRGVLNTVFQTRREPGLSNVLLGATPAHEAIHAVELGRSGTLHFMSTGTLPPNPAELLGSARMRALIETLEQDYDAIILDAPPLNLVTDAALLGTNADGVVVVARAAITEKGALAFAIEQLRNVRAPILGAVLNDVDFKRDARYYGSYGSSGYYYAYYYGRDADD